jgi:hypothetical protein
MATTTRVRLHLPKSHPAQEQVIAESRRFNVVVCGRRWGKTTMGMERIARPALDGYPVGWFAACSKLFDEAWRYAKKLFGPAASRISEQQHRLELITGGVLDMWSLESEGPGRGRKYARIVVDEAAYARNLHTDWQEAIRPTLTDYRGDAWFLSTPAGRNYFWQLYQQGQDPASDEWASWQMPTTANPYIAPEEVESARLDPHRSERSFLQEYMAVFLEDGAGVFRRVNDAATATPEPRIEGHTYVLGIDWGKLNDFTVLTMMDATTRRMVALDRFNQIDYRVQLGRLQALYERYRPDVILAERNSIGEPLIEQLQTMNMPVRPFLTTNQTKAAIIDGLALALERGDIAILNEPVLLNELLAYESERLPSGLVRYGAPQGLHDDCVISLALAVEAMQMGAFRVVIV